MKRPRITRLILLASLFLAFFMATASAEEAKPAPRHIELNIARANKLIDRFFDLSVGSDFPGTLIRDDSQAQLKTTVDELGFRYIRFHAIFHDVLSTVQIENGKNHRTGFRANDAYSAYIDMDAPKDLSSTQLDQLKTLTRDLPETDRIVRVGKNGSSRFSLSMRGNDVVLITLEGSGRTRPPGRTEGGLQF